MVQRKLLNSLRNFWMKLKKNRKIEMKLVRNYQWLKENHHKKKGMKLRELRGVINTSKTIDKSRRAQSLKIQLDHIERNIAETEKVIENTVDPVKEEELEERL